MQKTGYPYCEVVPAVDKFIKGGEPCATANPSSSKG